MRIISSCVYCFELVALPVIAPADKGRTTTANTIATTENSFVFIGFYYLISENTNTKSIYVEPLL
jgi:ABC-type phosphate transport system substrate-binding protein